MAQGDTVVVAQKTSGGTNATTDIRPASGESYKMTGFLINGGFNSQAKVFHYNYDTNTSFESVSDGGDNGEGGVVTDHGDQGSKEKVDNGAYFIDNSVGFKVKTNSASSEDAAATASGIQVK